MSPEDPVIDAESSRYTKWIPPTAHVLEIGARCALISRFSGASQVPAAARAAARCAREVRTDYLLARREAQYQQLTRELSCSFRKSHKITILSNFAELLQIRTCGPLDLRNSKTLYISWMHSADLCERSPPPAHTYKSGEATNLEPLKRRRSTCPKSLVAALTCAPLPHFPKVR